MKCALCGEEITYPYFFEDKAFGYTCIKIVNPLAKKTSPKKELWVKADSFKSSEIENGITKVIAKYQGGNYKTGNFSDFHKLVTMTNGKLTNIKPYTITIQNGQAYINLKAYKIGLQYLKITI